MYFLILTLKSLCNVYFLDFDHFKTKFGRKSSFWSDIFFDIAN